MATPTVSIVLPTYNRAATLARSVDSVFAQSYSEFELIIVDDGSTDETRHLIRSYKDKRVRYLYQRNIGAAAARNVGIQLAQAPYVAFQDSDDEWLPEKLRLQMEALSVSSEERSLVYSDMLRVSTNGSTAVLRSPVVEKGRLINPCTRDYQTFGIGLQTSIIKRAALLSIGGFDPRLPRFIDLDLFVRLSLQTRFFRLPIPLVKYYQTEGITSSFARLASAREYLLEKNKLYFDSVPKYRAAQLALQADALWKDGRPKDARRCCERALRSYPWGARLLARYACIRWLSPEAVERLRAIGRVASWSDSLAHS